MVWDPKIYLDFEDERTRPAVELLARVPQRAPERVIDLGCGPGNSTALLARRWPKAKLEGFDSSEPMLDQARRSGVAAQWIAGDIPGWTPQKRYDVIFSNACFQWVSGHDVLLPRLISYLEKGGALAFQVPGNLFEASHAAMREIAARYLPAEKLAEVRDVVLESPERYYEILEPHASQLDIWETTYTHVLSGEDAVFRWVSGTGLRPFLDALQGAARDDFVRDYKARLNAAYPPRASGRTLFPFRRIFAVARR